MHDPRRHPLHCCHHAECHIQLPPTRTSLPQRRLPKAGGAHDALRNRRTVVITQGHLPTLVANEEEYEALHIMPVPHGKLVRLRPQIGG